MNHANPWVLAFQRLTRNRIALCSLGVVGIYIIILLATMTHIIAAHWNQEVAVYYAPPRFLHASTPVIVTPDEQPKLGDNPRDPLASIMTTLEAEIQHEKPVATPPKATTLLFGADKWGRDIIQKTLKGGETSIIVGLSAALCATLLGTFLGAFAGYFGGVIDDVLNWVYSLFTSVPYLLLILTVAAVLQQKGVGTIILILSLTGWTGIFRLIRAEYLKHKEREYVLAAHAIGASHYQKMFVHIFPNISHVAWIQMSLSVVSFIKSEVILSFLGFGVPLGVVSWGSMLNEAQNELILGKWWQLVAATVAMAGFVTALSLLTDALRDALDTKRSTEP